MFEAPPFLTKDKKFPLVCDSVFRSMTCGTKIIPLVTFVGLF